MDIQKFCLFVISKFYQKHFTKIFKAESIVIAEFSKLLENIYRSVNIGFINEMKMIADKMGVDVFKIIEAKIQNHTVLGGFISWDWWTLYSY